jgi:hypothetical protein
MVKQMIQDTSSRFQVAQNGGVQSEVRVNKSSAESADQHSPGRKPWDQAWFENKP